MSCRIERIARGNHVILRISGSIQAEHVKTLKELITREQEEMVIDLKNVLLVNRDAVKLLALSESNGATLRNCPAYIREWVTRERARSGINISKKRGKG